MIYFYSVKIYFEEKNLVMGSALKLTAFIKCNEMQLLHNLFSKISSPVS